MQGTEQNLPLLNRREMLARAGGGLGALALASMLRDDSIVAGDQAKNSRTHHLPKATSVIWLFMNGGPSGIDLFDHKPELEKRHDQQFPGDIETLFPYPGPIMKSPFSFQQYGECGATVSEVLPNLARHVDDMTILKACSTQGQNHVPACYMMNTGVMRVGSPCVGSWTTFGLGTESENLPGFVVMHDHRSGPEGGANLWDAGFLPGQFQGVPFRPSDNPILYLKRNEQISARSQASQIDLLRRLNRRHLDRHAEEASLNARVESFETAFRMQMSAPEIVDLSTETEATKRQYGLDDKKSKRFGTQLLVARRLVEEGVRFVQIYHGGWTNNWDQHSGLEQEHRKLSREIDRPIAGLLEDLKQRGLLDSTLIVWGGEFGRTPTSQDRDGRDHNPFGFTMWLAGGGMRPGYSHGATDEFGYKAVENEVPVRDLHTTILHALGLDDTKLTYFHNGREQSLTNELGFVVRSLFA